ncbi:hypothetical protein [Sphaerimonospora thailandensis]|uniref:Uncharacterized protein n=1 Tax=Sphaerimonospora thailandensis TaxID=795644 RepID=A0A8J3W193_9ACTN|nr:hypothetical protein [Sphaerimonospora thailandensis]GIH71883.1 hypothetical protein Mth01_41360 [Sphaerimonospora thailandensis]
MELSGEHVEVAEQLIAAKAKNILRHYVEKILPEGFKAQVVAADRKATVRGVTITARSSGGWSSG